MDTFEDAAIQLESELSSFSVEKVVDERSRKLYKAQIMGENVNIILVRSTLTGSERAKPQIRVFTDKILELMDQSLENNERIFSFVYCKDDGTTLKFDSIDPREYLVSLESDWRQAGGRIDIRSIYEFINENPTLEFKKLNKSQHSAKSILQATIFKNTSHGFVNFENYIKFFDSRLVSQDSGEDGNVEASLESVGINKIYFGAPGTGKSYGIQEFIRENGIPEYEDALEHPNVFRTTLHPEFTYYDFVGQVMPVVKRLSEDTEDTTIEYEFVPGIFTKALAHAFSDEVSDAQPVFLILEEMSRANVASVFGDTFQLLDRDVDTGVSEYKINNDLVSKEIFGEEKPIYIPGNLFIIGTVNTNDQNVFVMDTAFKRRFEFEYVNANSIAFDEDDEKPLNIYEFTLEAKDNTEIKFNWITLYRALNKFITKKVENGGLGLKEDKQLGQFFIKFKNNDDKYNFNQIKGKLIQFLFDDIEENSYSSISIFENEINSYGEAYISLENRKNIFSEVFINEYKELEVDDIRKGYYDA